MAAAVLLFVAITITLLVINRARLKKKWRGKYPKLLFLVGDLLG